MNIDFNKFTKLDEKDLKKYYDSLFIIINTMEKSSKLITVNPKPIIPNTTKKEIDEFGFFSSKNSKSFTTIINPNYIYSISITDGFIDNVIPLMKKTSKK